MTFRQRFAYVMPYWVWRLFAAGMATHMKENTPVRTLAEMANYPDELLDRKGLYVKQLAKRTLEEYHAGL